MPQREPYIAAEGLLKVLGEEGLSKEQSYRFVKLLLQERNVFLRTFQEKVFGLGSAEINRPLQAALVMGLSFIVGAIIPIVPYMIWSGVAPLYVSALWAASRSSVSARSKDTLPASRYLCPVENFLSSPSAPPV